MQARTHMPNMQDACRWRSRRFAQCTAAVAGVGPTTSRSVQSASMLKLVQRMAGGVRRRAGQQAPIRGVLFTWIDTTAARPPGRPRVRWLTRALAQRLASSRVSRPQMWTRIRLHGSPHAAYEAGAAAGTQTRAPVEGEPPTAPPAQQVFARLSLRAGR
ncbi:hypothetical protein NDU88_001277 [Pleurodeles waltl]|uniref:Uncharacterized protein n=1 Tax=Pleurodeles waltl TaxID=8319 RepID=A0AAV7NCX7_PLEWA|nr:hypothetical protein NDU88_001277 [Pleurodeles waltl]